MDHLLPFETPPGFDQKHVFKEFGAIEGLPPGFWAAFPAHGCLRSRV
jgi:hypothetical protein